MVALSDIAMRLLEARYLKRDIDRKLIEDPEDMFLRVATAVASAERQFNGAPAEAYWQEAFYRSMRELEFLPNSPTLMNAGGQQGQLSACFVLPVNDSLDDIFDTLKLASLIQQSGGGTGFDFSRLRPNGDIIHTTGGSASGPVSFIKIFDAATEHIKQGGKRRGANMAVLDVSHPDIEEFIKAKMAPGQLENFNLSVGISDAFVQAVKHDTDWHLINPRTGKAVRTMAARDLQTLMAEAAWTCGDPGVLFLGRLEKGNPTPALGRLTATNPCGEMPLLPYEACNLGSVNLSLMVVRQRGNWAVDWEKLASTISLGVRFLDDVIEVNHYPSPEIARITKGNRKIGLGVMGWAEMLIRLGIPYDSKQAVSLADELMSFIFKKSLMASIRLAEERGSFPNWDKSVYHPSTLIRNATRTSIAPTGSISIIAGCSSSIEPLFGLAFTRKSALDGPDMVEFNQYFLKALESRQLDTKPILEAVRENGNLSGMTGIPDDLKRLFKTSLEISPGFHIRHQSAFQQYTDCAVSKTINLPNSASHEDVRRVSHLAWAAGLKGITVYRNGCRSQQALHQGLQVASGGIELLIDGSQGCKVCLSP